MITFAPPSTDINNRHAYLYSYDDQLQVSHHTKQDDKWKNSGEFGCMQMASVKGLKEKGHNNGMHRIIHDASIAKKRPVGTST